MSFFKNLFSKKKDAYQEPEKLLEEASLSCPITAIVEQDDRVAYFYLWGPEQSRFGVKACWIRNLQEAPDEVDKKGAAKGRPPMMPKKYCRFPEGEHRLNKEELSIIWTEEGDGAALMIKDEIVCIIPSWAGQSESDGGFFSGYAKSCIGQGNFAWELTESNTLIDRIRQSEEYWNSWDNEPNPFQIQQPLILDVYDNIFGDQDQYFAIDGGKFPPKGLYLRKGTSKIIFATVALSLLPMPQVEMYTEDRFELHRIELGVILDAGLSDKMIQDIAGTIGGQSSIPWDHISFLGEGHTVNFSPLAGTKFNAVLLTNKLDVLPKPNIANYRGSKINFLWMVPISEKERNDIKANGSESLIEKLNSIGEAVFSLEREEVV